MKECSKCHSEAGKLSVNGATIEDYDKREDTKTSFQMKYKRLCKYCFMQYALGVSHLIVSKIRNEDFNKEVSS